MLFIYYKFVTLCYGLIVAKPVFFVKKICGEICEKCAGFSCIRQRYRNPSRLYTAFAPSAAAVTT